jgi:hypothetical protein
MEQFYKILRIAMQNQAISSVLDILVKMAEFMVEKGEKERAVEILTISLEYPLREESRKRAQFLYNDLATEVCPRVFEDARSLAAEITLDDLLEAILSQA